MHQTGPAAVLGAGTAGLPAARVLDRVLATAEHDPVVARQFGRVIGPLDALASPARPAILRRVPLVRAPAPVRRRTAPTSSAVRQVSS